MHKLGVRTMDKLLSVTNCWFLVLFIFIHFDTHIFTRFFFFIFFFIFFSSNLPYWLSHYSILYTSRFNLFNFYYHNKYISLSEPINMNFIMQASLIITVKVILFLFFFFHFVVLFQINDLRLDCFEYFHIKYEIFSVTVTNQSHMKLFQMSSFI